MGVQPIVLSRVVILTCTIWTILIVICCNRLANIIIKTVRLSLDSRLVMQEHFNHNAETEAQKPMDGEGFQFNEAQTRTAFISGLQSEQVKHFFMQSSTGKLFTAQSKTNQPSNKITHMHTYMSMP